VVGNVKGRRGRNGVLVVDEVDRGDAILGLHARVIGQNDDIGAKEITVSENKLHGQNKGTKKISDAVRL
jgi:hypothetical protein